MDKAEASSVIAASISRGTGTPCTWRSDRDAYIFEQLGHLTDCLIDPVPVRAAPGVLPEEHFHYGSDVRDYFAIAAENTTWLLYSSETGHFAKAFGADSDHLTLLGPQSDDALAEWLG
jgi:hypothetical protein